MNAGYMYGSRETVRYALIDEAELSVIHGYIVLKVSK